MRIPQWLTARRLVLLTLLFAVAAGAGVATYRQLRWKRFAVVAEGEIYRSGALSESQLAHAAESLHLKTVICLAPELAEQDHAVCVRHGIRFVAVPMHSSGVASADQYARVLDELSDRDNYPMLVHCQAGVARTGASIALYRVIRQGWTLDAALAELASFERKGRLEPELRAAIEQALARTITFRD